MAQMKGSIGILWVYMWAVIARTASVSVDAFSAAVLSPLFRHAQPPSLSSNRKMTAGGDSGDSDDFSTMSTSFDETVLGRYACTRFQRYDNNATTTDTPSPSNQTVVLQAFHCLDLARRAPSGFNAQPYKVVLVHTPEQKKAMSKYCLGHNAHRVRDSDCTAVFCADREVVRTMGKYADFLQSTNPKWKGRRWTLLKLQALIALFSSGYPLPRFLAVPISFCARLGVSIISVLTNRLLLVPSLSNAETWSTKNTMLVAMTYMLGCSSRGMTTSPMEGFNAGGVRKALKIPRRYAIPLIVATGNPYQRPKEEAEMKRDSSDDMGMTHGSPRNGSKMATPRYSTDEVVFGDSFGKALSLPA